MAMQIKYPTPNSERWALWKWADIPSSLNKNEVYLRRLRVVQTPWFGMYVHWINEADSDRYPHDHPWRFWSFICRGSYTEQLYVWDQTSVPQNDPRTHRRFSFHGMPLHMAHKIAHVTDELITVVLTGKRQRKFCFWTPTEKIPWDKMQKGK